MLAHRLRRWPNVQATMGECMVHLSVLGIDYVAAVQQRNACGTFRSFRPRSVQQLEPLMG